MRLKIRVLIWLFVGSLSLVGTVKSAVPEDFPAQRQLPNDLAFTGRDTLDWDSSTPHLAIVDAETLKTSAFYQDNIAVDLRAVSWSPQGDLLAVLHIYAQPEGEYGYPTALCVVTVSGDLQTCLHEKTPRFFAQAPFLIDFEYEVTWSADARKVYYVTEDVTQGTRRLIEADSQTGDTLRTIYETQARNDKYVPTILAWTPNLSYVAAGVGFPDRSGVLVNLTTGELQDLSSIVVPWSDGGVRNRPEGRGFVCNQFSPQGTYLSAINEDDGQLVIFDATLYISHIINGFGVEDPSQAVIYCPSWNQNETVVYFPVRELTRDITSVFTYSLETEQLSKLYQGTIYPPLEFSPNRSHFVFDLVLPSIARIHVVYPDGEIQLFGDPFQYAQYPIWRPASDQ